MLNEKENSLIDLAKKVRVRVAGVLVESEKILLIKHHSIGDLSYLWLPPGGGVEYGESAEDAIIREFKEETNIEIEIEKFLFTNEMINNRHHAIELFFLVRRISGEIKLGKDPEYDTENQILEKIQFFSQDELNDIPTKAVHNAFNTINTIDKIAELKGLITFKH